MFKYFVIFGIFFPFCTAEQFTIFNDETCGPSKTCYEPQYLSCANLKPCVECQLSSTGPFSTPNGQCEKNCHALPQLRIVESLSDDPQVPETNCSMIDSDKCRFHFQYGQAFDFRTRVSKRLITISATKFKICPNRTSIRTKPTGRVRWKGWLVCHGNRSSSPNDLDLQNFKNNFDGLKNCEFREANPDQDMNVNLNNFPSERREIQIIEEPASEEKANCGGMKLKLSGSAYLLISILFIHKNFQF